MFRRLKAIGPGAIVAAAFIGPGTITVASTAGGNFGYSLLWAVAFSTLSCLVLQEMSARLGIVGQLGVGDAIRQKFSSPALKVVLIGLVLGAILVGNAAYESGNISGGVLGINLAAGASSPAWLNPMVVLVVAGIAFGLLWTAKYKVVERALVCLVATMGLVFLTTAALVQPDWSAVFSGLLAPEIPEGSLLKVVALIGTTVVPYNLFLHAAAVQSRWRDEGTLSDVRIDTAASILGGGLITAAIVITAAPLFESTNLASGDGAAGQYDLPAIFDATAGKIGIWFRWFMAFGFLAAGLSSAITAPLAAAYATAELFGCPKDMSGYRFRATWILVLAVGTCFAMLASKPEQLIIFAQVANGLLLPIIGIFLVWVVNDEKLLGDHKNGWFANILGGIVILVTAGLGVTGILKALKVLG